MRVIFFFMLSVFCTALLAAEPTEGVRIGAAYSYRFGDDLQRNDDGSSSSSSPQSMPIKESGAGSMMLEWPDSSNTWWQLYASHFSSAANSVQNGVTTHAGFEVDHLQIGGLKEVPDGSVIPYLGSTLGLGRITLSGTREDTRTRLSFSIFGGVRTPLAQNLSLALEARWLGLVFNGQTELRCDEDNCRANFKSGVWSQGDVALKVMWHF